MNRLHTLITAAGLVATACVPADDPGALTVQAVGAVGPPPADVENDWIGYRAGGNEPFWNLELTDSTMYFTDIGTEVTASAPQPDPVATTDGWRFEATSQGQPFVAEVTLAGCSDTMSGRPFPHTVTVTVIGQTYEGCGGDTATLLTGEEWRVAQIQGTDTASVAPRMTFAEDGSLTGHGTCNSFRAQYEITGEGINITAPVATRMACADDALNQQEVRFFSVLEQVSRFDVVEGRLQLYAMDTVVLLADR